MKNNFIAIIVGIILAALLLFCFLINNKVPKLAYVELEILYNDFPMKKELEAKLTNVRQLRKNILDSLKIQLNALSLSVKSDKDADGIRNFQIKKQEYLTKQQNFEQDNQATSQNYTSQIWKQINQYVKDYGKEHNYTFILGAEGIGTVMYSDEAKNITKELSGYINEKYKGEKK